MILGLKFCGFKKWKFRSTHQCYLRTKLSTFKIRKFTLYFIISSLIFDLSQKRLRGLGKVYLALYKRQSSKLCK